MDEERENIEHRLDQLDAWHQSEEAVRADRRARMQVMFSIANGLSVLINLYLSLFPRK